MREPELSQHVAPLHDAPHRRRGEVLEVLQHCREALPVGEVAERVGLHVNTARFHLEQLVRSGAVERTPEVRSTPGRPRTLYRALHGPFTDRRSYGLLTEILVGSWASHVTHPAEVAAEAGRQWGRAQVQRVPGSNRPDMASASTALVDVLDRVGFAPEAVTEGRRRRILLHHCPFLEAAQRNPEVVCAIHLGLMEGVLGKLRAPLVADRLEPFVTPELCVAHLTSQRRTGLAASAAR